ncbi:hypothetical protein INR49_006235 [Caranx melampygus]|nr:hypothetical protein INR49_006235 [Caranx melampygus]
MVRNAFTTKISSFATACSSSTTLMQREQKRAALLCYVCHLPQGLSGTNSVIIFLLGFIGNALVIWIAGFKMKKTVNTTWYLSLAISDFMFCCFLPFSITSMVMEEWIFGYFMCKFTSSVMFLNMFSSIFLLVIISFDRCISVMFPVWVQNQRTVKKASVVVVFAWILAVGLSIPSVIFRQVGTHLGKTVCFNNYTMGPHSHKIVAVSRFLAGFIVPFIIIIICYSIIICKLRTNRMTKNAKPFKVMTALVAAFFICWLPYHVFVLLELNPHYHGHSILTSGLKIGTCVAAANSFLNPVLYVFMGNNFKRMFMSSVVSNMKNAMGEEGRTISRYLSRSLEVSIFLALNTEQAVLRNLQTQKLDHPLELGEQIPLQFLKVDHGAIKVIAAGVEAGSELYEVAGPSVASSGETGEGHQLLSTSGEKVTAASACNADHDCMGYVGSTALRGKRVWDSQRRADSWLSSSL